MDSMDRLLTATKSKLDGFVKFFIADGCTIADVDGRL